MKKVKLTSDALGITKEFDLEHAQRILNFEKSIHYSGWKLDDKNFTQEENGTIKPKGKSQGAQE